MWFHHKSTYFIRKRQECDEMEPVTLALLYGQDHPSQELRANIAHCFAYSITFFSFNNSEVFSCWAYLEKSPLWLCLIHLMFTNTNESTGQTQVRPHGLSSFPKAQKSSLVTCVCVCVGLWLRLCWCFSCTCGWQSETAKYPWGRSSQLLTTLTARVMWSRCVMWYESC